MADKERQELPEQQNRHKKIGAPIEKANNCRTLFYHSAHFYQIKAAMARCEIGKKDFKEELTEIHGSCFNQDFLTNPVTISAASGIWKGNLLHIRQAVLLSQEAEATIKGQIDDLYIDLTKNPPHFFASHVTLKTEATP